MGWLKRVAALILCLIMTACSTQDGIRDQFEKSLRAYNRMLRWQEVESAGMTYIDPVQRDKFMQAAESLKKRGVTMTDFRILSFECRVESKAGDAVTEFDYYILPSNRVKSVTYRQKWIYKEDQALWRLTSGLPAFE
ncbi:MAG TPA: hypothetical protein HPP94_14990 [Desulfuromonadales bacterium]|nr:hypothetical protein [Desulfuromonadales bacterium]